VEYGADLLIALVGALPGDVVLAVFGPGDADLQVVRALDARGLGDRVLALGELPARTALAVVAASDLFVRPTRADGDSLAVREARALGIRVVASDAAARPPGTALFATGDWRSLARAVKRALAAPPPPPARGDGFPALLALYQEDRACAASQVASTSIAP
jgi:glycosyltransferase involved in cell wall biosynthesis